MSGGHAHGISKDAETKRLSVALSPIVGCAGASPEPLVTETVVDDGALRQHVAMRFIDDRFVVLWPPTFGSVGWPPALLSVADLIEHAGSIPYKSAMPLIRADRLP